MARPRSLTLPGQSSLYTHCTLKIPLSLTRAQTARTQGNTPAVGPSLAMSTVPDLTLPSSLTMSSSNSAPSGPVHGTIEEEFRVIKTCFSITIRRDRYGIPVAIMGSWIVSRASLDRDGDVCADKIADRVSSSSGPCLQLSEGHICSEHSPLLHYCIICCMLVDVIVAARTWVG